MTAKKQPGKMVFGRPAAEVGVVVCLVALGVILCYVVIEWFVEGRGLLAPPKPDAGE